MPLWHEWEGSAVMGDKELIRMDKLVIDVYIWMLCIPTLTDMGWLIEATGDLQTQNTGTVFKPETKGFEGLPNIY